MLPDQPTNASITRVLILLRGMLSGPRIPLGIPSEPLPMMGIMNRTVLWMGRGTLVK